MEEQSGIQLILVFALLNRNEKAGMVANVFHSVAAKYDLMNDLDVFRHPSMSGNVLLSMPIVVRCGRRVLDLAEETGDF